MKTAITRKIIAIVALASLASSATLSQTFTKLPPTGLPKFETARNAEKDLKSALVLAKAEKKNVMLYVGGEWCGWCKKLSTLISQDAHIAKALFDNYVLLKVNYSRENDNKAFLSQYPAIKGYPHLFVLDAKGKLLHSQDTGLLEEGDHHDPKKILEFLHAWAPKPHKS